MTTGVGLIGCGFIGTFHSRNIRGLIRSEVVDASYQVVADLDGERAGRFAGLAGVDRWTTNTQEVIESPDVSAVYICTQTAGHKNLVLAAAAAGKAVFCEKPLAPNLADVREMVEAVERAGVPNQVGLVLRYSPIFLVLKELTNDPSLGRLMSAVFRDDQYFPITGQYASTWRGDHAQAGGGTMIEHSIHDLDMLRFFCGEPERVSALTRFFYEHDQVEDLAVATIEFEGGAVASLTSIWHGVSERNTRRHLELFYENGVFWVDDDFFGPIHYQTNDGGEGVVSDEEVRRRYQEMMGLEGEDWANALYRWTFEDYFFLKALEEGTKPYPGFEVALEGHILADAVYRSASLAGAPVELDRG
ncbi:MAG: Gfo/Idh/MocA family oxidoreductase [Dehalococcoidia bacterium]